RGEDLLALLLVPARLRMAHDLVAPRLAHGSQPLVEERRLDPGRALVDPEDEPAHDRYSAVRRHHGPDGWAGAPGASGRSGPCSSPCPARRATTCSAIPSDAVRPVERIAATLTSCGQARDGPMT